MDHKLFELKFQEEAEDPSKVLLHQALQTGDPEEWQDLMLLLVNKMLADTTYERDTVITFVRGQYYRPTKARNDEADIFFAANLNQAEELSYGSQGILLPFWKT